MFEWPLSFCIEAEFGRLMRFGLAGLANTVVGFSVVALLESGFGLGPMLSNAGGLFAGVAIGFVLNTSFVFGAQIFDRAAFGRYITVFTIAFCLEQLVLAVLLWNQLSPVPVIFAQPIALMSYSIAYFMLCRFWVFRRRLRSAIRPQVHDGGEVAMMGTLAERNLALDTFVVNAKDDHPSMFRALRGGLIDSEGRSYAVFLQSLQTDFGRVKCDLAYGYGFLTGSVVLVVAMASIGATPLLTIAIGALFIGYWIAYIQLFIHEAAHYNLAATHEDNDRLCNLLISWMIGTTVAQYRVVHFQHHRALGTVGDSETTYFSTLNFGFLIKTLLGLRAVEVLLARHRFIGLAEARTQCKEVIADSTGERHAMKFIGLAIHGTCVLTLWYLGGFAPALAWCFGVGMVFPLCGALRQLLEHRRDDARADLDYRISDHGAFTRMFGDDAFSASFGGAGFNRHLLHHWEPQLSYTHLPALERFLLDTEMRPIIEARRSNYIETFLKLMSWPWVGHLGLQNRTAL